MPRNRPLAHDADDASSPLRVSLTDLFELKELQQIQDSFAVATGVASIITHPDGTPITSPSNFCRLCCEIIRKTEKGRANCFKSDAVLGRHNPAGPVLQICLSGGLWDAGASITVGGRHVGNWLIGQVRNEAQDDARMLAYADDIGADKEEFSAALAEVPRMSVDHFHNVSNALFLQANQLSEKAYQNLLLKQTIKQRELAEKELKASEERYRRIVETATEGIASLDAEGRITYTNSVILQMWGYTPEELLGRHVTDFLNPEDHADHLLQLDLRKRGVPGHYERRHRTKDGGEVWCLVSSSPVIGPDGSFQGSFGMLTDITESKRAEMALRLEAQRRRILMEHSTDGIVVIDHEHRIVEANERFANMLGYSREEVVGLFTWDYEANMSEAEIRTGFATFQGVNMMIETRHRRKDGSAFDVEVSISGTLVGDQALVFAICRDITERKQLEEQLLFRALHDPLTGLANRTLCLDRIAQANERAARQPGSTFSVVFIDLDRFKLINDCLGHEAGDFALKEVAARLLSCARRVDTVCRYGGDEFILVMENLSLRQTVRTIKRVRESLKAPLVINKHELQLEASYGITYASHENHPAEVLLRNANIALHRAKTSGRDKIVTYRSCMHEAAIHTMSLQSDMRRGLDSDEFFMVYQPIFTLDDNRLAGFEALIRWRHPQRGIVSPVEFIPMAEESGLIFELGGFALSQACKDMVDLLKEMPTNDHLTVSVNLSPRQFGRQGLVEQIEQALMSTGLPPSALVLEITESSIMKYPEASAHILARLKDKGVSVAIDDFGTGYSSLSALQKLPLDRLKVDMSFVSRMIDSREDHEIIRAIITLAHSLSLKTVAEGIEIEAQRMALHMMNCDLGQGYLCSRPIPLADVPHAIRHMARSAVSARPVGQPT